MARRYDAVVVGAGPNGLSAAIALARAGRSVVVVERSDAVGGGCRSAELTLPGFVHDVCSGIHPLAAASPFFRALPLEAHGLEWVHPEAPFAHPFEDGTAALLERSVEQTAEGLAVDARAYRRLVRPLVSAFDALVEQLWSGAAWAARHPLSLARFGVGALRSAHGFAFRAFRGARARALFGGAAAHAMTPLERPLSAAAGLLLVVSGHAVGWPFPRGGAQRLSEALASYLRSLGGEIVTGWEVASIDELPPARVALLDLTPWQLLRVAGHRLPERYRRRLERLRAGPGVFKLDYALSGPIPWSEERCARAGTLHVGGIFEEVAAAMRATHRGEVAERPFLLVAQHTRFDATRAPDGKHTAWVYTHVPLGSTVDPTERMERQLERFAPGFGRRVLARHTLSPAQLERHNPNNVGGDISGGTLAGLRLLLRPVPRLDPYSTPDPGIFLCSSSTPPGPGVHGMCGFLAAQSALRGEALRRRRWPASPLPALGP